VTVWVWLELEVGWVGWPLAFETLVCFIFFLGSGEWIKVLTACGRHVAIEWVLFLGSIAFLWRNNSSSLFWSLIDLWGILFYSLIDLWGIWGNEWARTFVLLSPTLVRLFCYLLSLVDFDPLGVSWTLFSSSFTFVGIIFIIFQVL
jgi:hypothetical protein